MVSAYTSTKKAKWRPLEVKPAEAPGYGLVTGAAKRGFWGFGGCFNEQGGAALDSLTAPDREKVLDAIFRDLHFDFCRLPAGASDYALDWYSYDETDGDYALERFSIERDKKILIPYVKEALKRNPGIKFFASPWSPPAWMKEPKVYNYGRLTPTPENLNAYALYLVKYLRAYEAEGINISQLHFQNEIYADQKFPSCVWDAGSIGIFVHKYLAPAFKKYGVQTEIWLGTVNGGAPAYEDTVFPLLLGDKNRDFHGVAYQWSGKESIAPTVESFPDIPVIQSENECGDGENTWEYCKYVFGLARHYIKAGARAYCYWNMILPKRNGRSTWGWKQNCLVSAEGGAAYHPEYYLFKHLSAFVGAGSRVLETSGPFSSMALAFRNTDGQTVAVVSNPLSKAYALTLNCGAGYQAVLPADSVTTIIIG